MAALHYAAANTTSLHHRYRQFTTETFNPRKPSLLISCFTSSSPSKSTRRKNHLRHKILKTLPESIIPKIPLDNPIIPIDSPPRHEIKVSEIIKEIQESDKSQKPEAGNEEVKKLEQLRKVQVSVPAGVRIDGTVGILAKNPILKYGLWLVGAFLFQTVCAAYVLGSARTASKNEILSADEEPSVLEVGGNGEGKSMEKIFLNGNGIGKMGVGNSAVDSVIYVDELEMERKIEEIRVMAREVREKERLESKKNGSDSEDSDETDGGKYSKSGIEEEVDNRLIKLKKKLEKGRDKMPVASVGHSRKDNQRKGGVEKGELEARDGNGALLFKQKYKFNGLPGDSLDKPEGFFGSDDKSMNKTEVSGI